MAPSEARRSLVETISLPSGAMATAASLKFPSPSGIPTIVKQSTNPRTTCAIEIQTPASRNQSTFPTMDAAPAPGRRITVLPNGHKT